MLGISLSREFAGLHPIIDVGDSTASGREGGVKLIARQDVPTNGDDDDPTCPTIGTPREVWWIGLNLLIVSRFHASIRKD